MTANNDHNTMSSSGCAESVIDTYSFHQIENCSYRLPCGLCKELNRTCPLLPTKITWEAKQ